jgi:Galactokinase galactose-binding signature
MTLATGGGISEWFAELYGQPPEGVWRSPGRVNIIGEHTDYNGGSTGRSPRSRARAEPASALRS